MKKSFLFLVAMVFCMSFIFSCAGMEPMGKQPERVSLPPGNGWVLEAKNKNKNTLTPCGHKYIISDVYIKKQNGKKEVCSIGYYVDHEKKHKVNAAHYIKPKGGKLTIISSTLFLENGKIYTEFKNPKRAVPSFEIGKLIFTLGEESRTFAISCSGDCEHKE